MIAPQVPAPSTPTSIGSANASIPASSTVPQSPSGPRRLANGPGRLAAASAAGAVALTTGFALGQDVSLTAVVTLDVALLLSFGAFRFGMPGGAGLAGLIGATAVGLVLATPVARLFLIPQGLQSVAQAIVAALVGALVSTGIALLWKLWTTMSGRGVLLGLITVASVGLWLLSLPLGVYYIGDQQLLVPAAAALGVALGAWTLETLNRATRWHMSAAVTALRDLLFRLSLLGTGVIGALWVGGALRARFAIATWNGPLESLAPTVGWTATLGLLACVTWTLWRGPSWLNLAQLRGRIRADAAAEPLFFAMCASVAPFALLTVDTVAMTLGRACCVALAASAAYAYTRLRYARPPEVPGTPLWIVLVGDPPSSKVKSRPGDTSVGLRRRAEAAAAAWRSGPVTILARPATVHDMTSGEHLRAADRVGQGSALFPLRAVHLEDWDEAQPEEWLSMPVRELYAPADLWPTILRERLAPSSHVLVLHAAAFTQDIRQLLWNTRGPDIVSGLFVSPSKAPLLRPELSLRDATRLAESDALTIRGALITRLREMQSAGTSRVVRHIILQCAAEDLLVARELAWMLQDMRDVRGRRVECVVLRESLTFARLVRPSRAGTTLHTLLFFTRVAIASGFGTRFDRMLLSLFGTLIERSAPIEFDLVVLERPAGPGERSGLAHEFIVSGLESRSISRLIAIRSDASQMSRRLTYAALLYDGQVRLPAARPSELARLTRKLLELDLAPVDLDEDATSPLRAPRHPGWPMQAIRIALLVVLPLAAGGLGFMYTGDTPSLPSDNSSSVLLQAQALRERGDLKGAIARLTTEIDAAAATTARRRNPAELAQMRRDRAYCYKLQSNWRDAIPDLTAALSLTPQVDSVSVDAPGVRKAVADARARDARDRAFAFLRLQNVEGAMFDYEMASRLDPDDRSAADNAALLRTVLTPSRRSDDVPLFVFLPVGAVNGPAFLPPQIGRLPGRPYVNLRFWWQPITRDIVYYTDTRDEPRAREIANALDASGLAVGSPVGLLTRNAPTVRRIEIWLTRRYGAAAP